MIVMSKADKLEFKLSCKIELLEEQLEAMEKYTLILETRAIIEEIELMEEELEMKFFFSAFFLLVGVKEQLSTLSRL